MEFTLEDLKKEYSSYKNKHKLPDFSDVNETFEIEKIDRKSECMLKLVRKVMMEKVINTIGFVEMLLNPVNAPRLYYSYLKGMSVDDKHMLEKVYEKLSDLSVDGMALEIEYSEKGEADLIKKIMSVWNENKKVLTSVLHHVKNPKQQTSSKSRDYFG